MYIILMNCSCMLKSRLRFMFHDYVHIMNFFIIIIIIYSYIDSTTQYHGFSVTKYLVHA